jgi:hypothetical protein
LTSISIWSYLEKKLIIKTIWQLANSLENLFIDKGRLAS